MEHDMDIEKMTTEQRWWLNKLESSSLNRNTSREDLENDFFANVGGRYKTKTRRAIQTALGIFLNKHCPKHDKRRLIRGGQRKVFYIFPELDQCMSDFMERMDVSSDLCPRCNLKRVSEDDFENYQEYENYQVLKKKNKILQEKYGVVVDQRNEAEKKLSKLEIKSNSPAAKEVIFRNHPEYSKKEGVVKINHSQETEGKDVQYSAEDVKKLTSKKLSKEEMDKMLPE